jgi:hypothetical protein
MASYTVTTANGEVAAHAKTLVAATADTVTYDDREDIIEVITDGTADIYFRTDGTAPTVGDPKAYRVPAGERSRKVTPNANTVPTQVKLISAATPTYSVQRAL